MTTSDTHISSAISTIQERCGFYNYEIAQFPLAEEDKSDSLVDILKQIKQILENQSKAPKYDLRHANIDKLFDSFSGFLNEYNYTSEQKHNLAEAAASTQQLLNELASTTSEDERKVIVNQAFEQINTIVNSINSLNTIE